MHAFAYYKNLYLQCNTYRNTYCVANSMKKCKYIPYMASHIRRLHIKRCRQNCRSGHTFIVPGAKLAATMLVAE